MTRMTPTTRRSGFTLVEILVVLAIIAILAALTLSAMGTVVDSQRQSATESLILEISKTVDQQIKAIVDKADKDPMTVIPDPIQRMAMANVAAGATATDLRRTRVIWKKFLLKKEFPTTFAEALTPHLPTPPGPPVPPTVPPTLGTVPLPPNAGQITAGNLGQFWLTALNFRPNPTYQKVLAGAPAGLNESSICLLLAIQENRGGASLNADKLPSGRVVLNAGNLKEIHDLWGQPLTFFRFPMGNVGLRSVLGPIPPQATGELDAAMPGRKAPPYSFIPRTGEYARNDFRDPLDPEGLLLDPSWNNATNLTTWQGVYWFEWYVHPVHVWPNNNPKNYTQVAVYNVPVIVSPGRNMLLGVNANLTPTIPLNDANDNIVSWRLRAGVKSGS